ncbi:MAG: hypothetical protein KDK59_08845 [Simkania sp.]|nr:hypothetical protein [Simkania sp.]
MALKDTVKKMHTMLEEMVGDLKKAERGIKAASQRVRTGTIKFAKLAKLYRKESMIAERGGKKTAKKKTPQKKTKTVAKKAAPKKAKTPRRKTMH